MTITTLRALAPIDQTKKWIDEHRDDLVAYTQEHFPFMEREMAIAMFTHLWSRLINRSMKDHGYTLDEAEYYQAACFVYLRSGRSAPTSDEDIGWHVLLGYSIEYAAVTHALVGHAVPHLPNDIPGWLSTDGDGVFASRGCMTGHTGTGGDCINPVKKQPTK
jgi:hypothetical protein